MKRSDRSAHILPTSATMVGVCVTLIGLVKIVEMRIGPSRVDEYAGLASLLFLASALASYTSIRGKDGRFEAIAENLADLLFMLGLASITLIALFFAYEAI